MNINNISVFNITNNSKENNYHRLKQVVPDDIVIGNLHLNTNSVNFNSNEILVKKYSNSKKSQSLEKKSHTYSLQQILTKSLVNDCSVKCNNTKGENYQFDKTLIDDLRKQLNEISHTQPNNEKEINSFINAKQHNENKPQLIKNHTLVLRKNQNNKGNPDQINANPKKTIKPLKNEGYYYSQKDIKAETILKTNHSRSLSLKKLKTEFNALNTIVLILKNIILVQQKYIDQLGLKYSKIIEDIKQITQEKMSKLNGTNNNLKQILFKVFDEVKKYSFDYLSDIKHAKVILYLICRR